MPCYLQPTHPIFTVFILTPTQAVPHLPTPPEQHHQVSFLPRSTLSLCQAFRRTLATEPPPAAKAAASSGTKGRSRGWTANGRCILGGKHDRTWE